MGKIENPEIHNSRILQLRSLILKTKIIGIDIDGTLSETISAVLAEVRARYGDIMNFSQWTVWNPHQIPELQKQ
jgi:hypothetical protein